MAKTAAQRQAEYRARRAMVAGESGERRLNTWVSTAAHVALARIAQRYGVTQRAILERFILAEDQKILASLEVIAQSAPIKRDAVTEHGAAQAPSYGMLESRVVLLNAENIGLADKLQRALDEAAALKAALVDATSAAGVTRHGNSTLRNTRRT